MLACTPSYALYIAETIEEMGIKREELKLEYGIFGAEPWSEAMRKEIEEKMQISAIDIYGLSEVIGPGVASECQCKVGLHIFEDHFIPEIIDPETGEVLPPGQEGETGVYNYNKRRAAGYTISYQGYIVIELRSLSLRTNPCKDE